MVSPFLLLGAGAAVVAAASPKKKKYEKELVPGVPDNAKTRAYAQAVALVESVKAGKKKWGHVFNGAKGHEWPILKAKDLPTPPGGWVWAQQLGPQRATLTPDFPKGGEIVKQMPKERANQAMYWMLAFEGAGGGRLPAEIMAARPERPTFYPPQPHAPAAGYDELIEKLKGGMFWSPPQHVSETDIQY